MLREDAPRRQVLWFEVAKIERHNDRRFSMHCGRCDVTILFIVCHSRNQRLVTADPGLAEVGVQLLLKLSCERVGPPKFQFQRTGSLSNDLLRPLRLKEPGQFRKAQECIA